MLYTEDQPGGGPLRLTLAQDKLEKPEDAIIEIYRRLRPGRSADAADGNDLFQQPVFQSGALRSVEGRAPQAESQAFQDPLAVPLEQGTLRREDILEVVRYLIELKNGDDDRTVDDIDHLGNRRVRAVGELVENQFRIGLVRMERAIKERMSLQDIETLMPQELVNYKPASAVIKEFFGSSQLSQFMDQTNPL